MNYNELNEKLNELQHDDFGLKLLDEIISIRARNRDIYLHDLFMGKNSNEEYNYIDLMSINILINKAKNLGLNEKTINNFVYSITNNSMIIDNIKSVNDMILLIGKDAYNPNGKDVSRLFGDNLSEITSDKFTNSCDKINYFNSFVGRISIKRIVNATNNLLKENFKTEKDILKEEDGIIRYSIPLVNIYITEELNNICNDLISNDESSFDLVVKYDLENIQVFNVSMCKDNIKINEAITDITDLLNNDKGKSLH